MNKTPPPLPARRPEAPRTYPVFKLADVMRIIVKDCGGVVVERHGTGTDKVLILPEPAQELVSILSYGRRSPQNFRELKLIGLGHFVLTPDNSRLTLVTHFIQIHTTNRTPVSASNLGPDGAPNPGLDFLEYYRDEYLAYEREFNTDAFGRVVDPFLESCGHAEFVLDGHSHPDLGAFFSAPDKAVGRAQAAVDPVCLYVCDPIRRQMKAAVGKELADAEVIVFGRTGTSPQPVSAGSEQLLPPADALVRLASRCLRTDGVSGGVRLRPRPGGKTSLKIKLVVPGKE